MLIGDVPDVATVESLTAERDAVLAMLRTIVTRLDDRGRNSPGHGHAIDGVWDDDSSNGDKRGTACEWCATWKAARAMIE